MMRVYCTSVEEGYYHTLEYLNTHGKLESSRNGPVISCEMPASVTFYNPRNRVMFDVQRDANPFFHVMESIWMLAGRRDSRYVSKFVKRMESFSDDGITLNGAYGYRWRHHFQIDQIRAVCDLLEKDPQSRRAVVAMWDPFTDLDESRDLPCNTHIYFRVRGFQLDMTVCNRSNDAYWGLFGANAVHLSILHEVMSSALNLALGTWTHFTNNLHVYPDNLPDTLEAMAERARSMLGSLGSTPMKYIKRVPISFHNLSCFLWACEDFIVNHENTDNFHNMPFLMDVAYPMMKLWETRDLEWGEKILDSAWQTASVEWVKRRQK
jgi:thymidylate synthase